jgi:hypothetical protein
MITAAGYRAAPRARSPAPSAIGQTAFVVDDDVGRSSSERLRGENGEPPAFEPGDNRCTPAQREESDRAHCNERRRTRQSPRQSGHHCGGPGGTPPHSGVCAPFTIEHVYSLPQLVVARHCHEPSAPSALSQTAVIAFGDTPSARAVKRTNGAFRMRGRTEAHPLNCASPSVPSAIAHAGSRKTRTGRFRGGLGICSTLV